MRQIQMLEFVLVVYIMRLYQLSVSEVPCHSTVFPCYQHISCLSSPRSKGEIRLFILNPVMSGGHSCWDRCVVWVQVLCLCGLGSGTGCPSVHLGFPSQSGFEVDMNPHKHLWCSCRILLQTYPGNAWSGTLPIWL